MRVTILGSGAWDGVPAIGCDCSVCSSTQMDPSSKDFRTRPSILIESNNKSYLFDISPDARLQLAKRDLSNLDAVFITHSHYDHMFGLGELHAFIEFVLEKELTVYGSETVKKAIERTFGYLPLNFVVLAPDEAVELEDIKVTPVPVKHTGGTDNECLAFIVESNGQKWAYLGDYFEIENSITEQLSNSSFVVADGTYLLKDMFSGSKYADAFNNLNDTTHLQGDAVTNFTKSLGAKKVYFHSISHLHGLSHDELQAKMPVDHFVTYDNMQLE